MKRVTLVVLMLITSLVAVSCSQADKTDAVANSANLTELTEFSQKYSYAIGQDIAGSLKRTGMEIDLPVLIQGLSDAFAEKPSLLTEEETAQVMQEFQSQAQTARADQQKQLGDMNKKEGEEFLAANKEREGVMTTASGLQYMVLQEGDGPKPAATDRVTVNYEGTLIDGTVFDSSLQRGEPATFALNRVIPGWTEGLQLMNVGSKYRFFVPSELAYGERGPSPKIGPNSTLIFEVELLSIEEESKPE